MEKYNYVIGMIGKQTGIMYLANANVEPVSYNRPRSLHPTVGVKPQQQYASYDLALMEAKRLASIRSEDYAYLVLKVVASATIADKPVTVEEF